jgi:hypothetical protein
METVVMTQDPVLPFAEPMHPAPDAIASESSLLDIDREIDLMLDLMQDELEEDSEISEESRDQFHRFCEAFGQKVDRIGRFIRVMEARQAYCKSEAARLAARGKTAENKAAQTKALVLYFLETRGLTKMEGPQFTLRRQKNSQDSVKIKNPTPSPCVCAGWRRSSMETSGRRYGPRCRRTSNGPSMPAWRTVRPTTTASSARLRRERSSKVSLWHADITSASPDSKTRFNGLLSP